MSKPPKNIRSMLLGTGTRRYTSQLFYLILFSTIVRVFIAYTLELSNDEAYYRILSLSPQLGYEDHPPLATFLINLSAPNSGAVNEFLIRLFPLLIGVINTILIYLLASKSLFRARRYAYSSNILTTSDYRRGFLAALLYTASIYCTIFGGIMATPSTFLSLFWLLSLNILCTLLPQNSHFSSPKMLLAGIFMGLAMLSKFSGIYLWIATFLYITLYNRSILKKWSLYAALILSLAIFSPILLWNINHNFPTIDYLQGLFDSQYQWSANRLLHQILGAIFYNGVFNYLIIIGALLSYYVGRFKFLSRSAMKFLLVFSLPMIVGILFSSLIFPTLPHWSGAAYMSLIVIAAAHLADQSNIFALKFWQNIAIISIFLTISLCYSHIRYGIFDSIFTKETVKELNINKISLDMYGWEQLNDKFTEIYESDLQNNIVNPNPLIFTSNPYDAAHIDNYVAIANNLKLIALDSDYHYGLISEERLAGENPYTSQGYIILASSNTYAQNKLLQSFNLAQDTPYETISIVRAGDIVEEFYLYRVNANKQRIIVGSSTASSSKGIYLFDFDPITFNHIELNITSTQNPTFMSFSDDKQYLYAVAENYTQSAGVVSFSFNNNDTLPELTRVSSQLCNGAYPCHILTGQGWVATANYGGGSISTFRTNSRGEISPLSQLLEFNAPKNEQNLSHLHCLIPSPDGKTIFATDLGKDSIYRFSVSTQTEISNDSAIFKRLYPAISIDEGSGPRHLIFSDKGTHAYLICELSGDVKCFDYKENSLWEFQSEKSDSVGGGGSADIHISNDGKFLYASNRLKDDGISTFKIDETNGTIHKVGYTLTGIHPRNFAISPDDNFIFVACRDSDAIQIYRRNKITGELNYLGKEFDIELDAPMFVKFI